MRPIRRAGRFLERAILGSMMSVIAIVIERRLLKALKEKDVHASPAEAALTAAATDQVNPQP